MQRTLIFVESSLLINKVQRTVILCLWQIPIPNLFILAIGSMPDHIHIFIGYYLNELIPDLVEKIKTASNSWIKEKKLSKFKFDWSRHGGSYGAFTHSRSQLDTVVKYVLNQEVHLKRNHSGKNI